jgi:hypothetical protein
LLELASSPKKSAQLLAVALNRDLAPFSISLSWAGRMPNPYSPQENPLFVEQAGKPVLKNDA